MRTTPTPPQPGPGPKPSGPTHPQPTGPNRVELTPDPRISSTLPPWLPDRDALGALSLVEVARIDEQWQLAGGERVDTSWITMETIGGGVAVWPLVLLTAVLSLACW